MKERDLKQQFSELLALMEQDGTEEAILSRFLAGECVRTQYQTAFSFGIYHDLMVWESDILRSRLFEKAMKKLEEKGVAKKETEGEYKGCVVIDLASMKDLPKQLAGLNESTKVLIRSDGTPTYVAKDIAFHMWKLGLIDTGFKYSEFITQPNGKVVFSTFDEGKKLDFGSANLAINIIDSRQYYPQMILKLAFAAIGRKDLSESIVHLSYGVVEVEGASLSGRAGTWLGYTADDLLREAAEKAGSLITSRSELTQHEREKIAKSVAIGAIRFEFLKISPEKKILFSWKSALNFDGNSGPYCQYMNARASRILTDAGSGHRGLSGGSAEKITSDSEFALARLLSVSEHIVDKALSELRPSVVAEYLNDLASTFSKFYELCPILKCPDEEQKNGRIALTMAFRETMGSMLAMLGIEALERM